MGLRSRIPLARLSDVAGEQGLRRHLRLSHLVMIGIGGIIGAGIFVITGTAAANYAGPAVAISFVFAGVACLCAALCYAELASMIPVAGSAYTYTYATLGELVAWITGWNLILEYLLATSTLAVGWSGYVLAALSDAGIHLPAALSTPSVHVGGAVPGAFTGPSINLPAVLIILGVSAILYRGIRGSALFNTIAAAIKVAAVVLVIVVGARYVDTANWQPFVPQNNGHYGVYGWSGIVRAAGVVFFAYIGFDMVSSAAQEARQPRRDVPLAILISLAICTALYIGMSLVLTGLVPYSALNVAHPVFVAVEHMGSALAWLRYAVTIAVVIGLCSAMLVTLYGQTRIFFAMSRDGLIPAAFSRVHAQYRTPGFCTWFAGAVAALLAGLFPIHVLSELVSIGTLMAFCIVCTGVLILRVSHPHAERTFRTPWIRPTALTGIVACAYMMVSLPLQTWIRFVVWLVVGVGIYALYGQRRSQLAIRRRSAAPPA